MTIWHIPFFLFSFFLQKTGFDSSCKLSLDAKTDFAISCKLSPKETICKKCQSLFSGENKEKYFMLSALNNLATMLWTAMWAGLGLCCSHIKSCWLLYYRLFFQVEKKRKKKEKKRRKKKKEKQILTNCCLLMFTTALMSTLNCGEQVKKSTHKSQPYHWSALKHYCTR